MNSQKHFNNLWKPGEKPECSDYVLLYFVKPLFKISVQFINIYYKELGTKNIGQVLTSTHLILKRDSTFFKYAAQLQKTTMYVKIILLLLPSTLSNLTYVAFEVSAYLHDVQTVLCFSFVV